MPHSVLYQRHKVCTRSGWLYLELRGGLPGSTDAGFSLHAATDMQEVMQDLGITYCHAAMDCPSRVEAECEAELMLGDFRSREAFTACLDVTPQAKGASPIDGRVLLPHDAALRAAQLAAVLGQRGSAQLFG